jgi:hypothetical protein
MNTDCTSKYIRDERTGKIFKIIPESALDKRIAIYAICYLLIMLLFFFLALLDIYSKQFRLVTAFGFDKPKSPIFQLAAYTLIGGGIGGVINGIRSFLFWHCDYYAFHHRFVWKYITGPWTGTALALIVFALVHSGVAVLGGGGNTGSIDLGRALSMFSIGALAGYGSRDVFIWLDAQVKKFFRVSAAGKVPDLIGQKKEEAGKILKAAGMSLGDITEKEVDERGLDGTIIEQVPVGGAEIKESKTVDVVIAAGKVPELNGKTKEEAEAMLKSACMQLGEITEKETDIPDQIGTVIQQTPGAGTRIEDPRKVNVVIAAKKNE